MLPGKCSDNTPGMEARGFVVSAAKMWYMTDTNAADKLVMKHVGKKSAREIAELTGMDENWVLRRKNELLEEIDVLTHDQLVQKILIELREVAEKANDLAKSSLDEFKAGLFNSAIAANKEVLKQVTALRNSGGSDVERLNRLRMLELLRLLDNVVNSGAKDAAAEFQIDETRLLEIFRARIVPEAAAVEMA